MRILPSSLVALLALCASVFATEPELVKVDLFTANEGGYPLYRIPGIVVTAKGSLLAYCEARKNAKGDWGHIDILVRRSTDGGAASISANGVIARATGSGPV